MKRSMKKKNSHRKINLSVLQILCLKKPKINNNNNTSMQIIEKKIRNKSHTTFPKDLLKIKTRKGFNRQIKIKKKFYKKTIKIIQ